jgi:tetratricopeptide (TPR) repeat protein
MPVDPRRRRAYVPSVGRRGLVFVVAPWLALAALADQGPDRARRDQAVRHYRAGMQAMHAESWEQAEREFSAAVELDALLEVAHYGLGQVYMATRRYPEAVRAYTRCREAFHQGVALLLMDRATAERRLEDQIQATQDSLRQLQGGRVRTANTGASIQRLEDQIRSLQRQRKRDTQGPLPTPPSISLALGSALFRTGAFADAELEYRAALSADPQLGEAYNNLAVVYMLTGRLEEAEAALASAEKAGFRVNAQLKRDIEVRRQQSPRPQ